MKHLIITRVYFRSGEGERFLLRQTPGYRSDGARKGRRGSRAHTEDLRSSLPNRGIAQKAFQNPRPADDGSASFQLRGISWILLLVVLAALEISQIEPTI